MGNGVQRGAGSRPRSHEGDEAEPAGGDLKDHARQRHARNRVGLDESHCSGQAGLRMHVIADLCLIPLGVGVSVSKEIAACERVLAEAGLKTKLHAYGTNIEGEWDDVFAAIKRCHEVVHAMGAPRVSSSLRFGTRIDRVQTMEDKVESVAKRLR